MTIFEQIAAWGYAHVNHHVSQAACTDAETAFLDLLRTTPTAVLAETTIFWGVLNETPDGWMRKHGGSGGDRKQFIHFSASWACHERIARLRCKHVALDRFIESASAVYDGLVHPARELLGAFEARFPGAGFQKHFLCGYKIPGLTLRFLAYDFHKLESTVGQEHYDKSGLTLGIYESAPGLELKGVDEVFTPMPYTPGESPLMIGKIASTLTRGAYKPTWHRAIDRGHAPRAPDIGVGRTAIVCFIDQMRGAVHIPHHRETHTL